MEGFSAPLYLLKVKFDFIGYKDAWARFGTAVTYFYIDDGKLNKVLDVAEEVRGEGKFKDHKFVDELKLPSSGTGLDKIIHGVYSSRGSSKKLFAEKIYQWDWERKTFREIR